MPKIKIDHVVSFSSEDPVHVANNVLSSDPSKKWKCKNPGEKSAIIVLQLEKATVISGIDVGNENSAYIEVLVSRSGTNEDYKVLLVMSSFMTPLEARQSTNINKVRMFTREQLSKPECDQKWDRVKIVCTQPFNRHVQYGLSFINFNTLEEKAGGSVVQSTIGKFTLRPDSPDNLSVGSLFARKKELQQEQEPVSAAAAIRAASSSTSSPLSKAKIKINTPNKNNTTNTENKAQARNRNELLYNKDEEEPNEKIDKLVEKKAKEKKSEEEELIKKLDSNKTKIENKRTSKGESSKRKKDSSPKRESPKKKAKYEVAKKPFDKLLEGVTLVISGILNPDRSEIRAKALSMGAKYKPDWDNSCTHLICAFANTPKFNQVRGKGKIVKRTWIEECYKQRKRLPWRRFCLDKNDTNKPESEDEIWEKEQEKQDTAPQNKKESSDEDDLESEGFDDTKMQKKIEEIQARQRQKENENPNNVYSADTDEEIEEEIEEKEITKKLPEFFDYKTFYIDPGLEKEVYQMLERYIVAYAGILVEKPSSDVDFIITTEKNVEDLQAKSLGPQFVRPDWIWECHNLQSLIPTDKYEY